MNNLLAKHRELLWYFCIVSLLTITTRLIFATGVTQGAQFDIAANASTLSRGYPTNVSQILSPEVRDQVIDGIKSIRATHGMFSIPVFLPFSIVYALAGVTEIASIAIPIISALIVLLLSSAITFHLLDERAAIAFAFLWALFPLDIFYSSSLLITHSILLLSLASIYVSLVAMKHRWKLCWLFIVFIDLIVIMLNPLAGISVLVLLVFIWSGKNNRRRHSRLVTILLLSIFLLLIANQYVPLVILNQISLAIEQPEIIFLAPFILVAGYRVLLENERALQFVLMWILVATSIAIIGQLSVVGNKSILTYQEGIYSLFLMIPVTILTAVGLTRTISVSSCRRVYLMITFMVEAILLITLFANLTSPSGHLSLINNFLLLSSVAAGLLVPLIFVFPLLDNNGSSFVNSLFLFLILLVLALANGSPTWNRRVQSRQLIEATQQSLAFLGAQELDLQVQVEQPIVLDQILFLKGYERENVESAPIEQDTISLVNPNINSVRNTYVILGGDSGNGIKIPPNHWQFLHQFGNGSEVILSIYLVRD